MAIRPDEFRQAAEALKNLRPPLVNDEVCARTIAGRAYYSAYLATREAIRAQIQNPTFDVNHSRLAAVLEAQPDQDISGLGTSLKMLRNHREIADYRLDGTLQGFHVVLILAEAKRVLDTLPKLAGKLPTTYSSR